MNIIPADLEQFDKWRHQIEGLFNCSVRVNFPDYLIGEEYGKQKCDQVINFLKNGSAVVYLAIEDNALAGWIWCHRINRLNKQRLHIAEIAVCEEYLRNGIGRALLDKAEEYAEQQGIGEVDLFVTASNSAAVRFYENADYLSERYLMRKIIRK